MLSGVPRSVRVTVRSSSRSRRRYGGASPVSTTPRSGAATRALCDGRAGLGGDRFGDGVGLLSGEAPCLIGPIVRSPAANTSRAPMT